MKCDFHCHTLYSFDSTTSPKEMVDRAIERGIDCLAITDHDEIKGALEAIEYAKGKPILIIPGIEVKSKEGDILGLNVKEKIEKGLSAKETIEKIKKLGGMVILPHPFGIFCSFKGKIEDFLSQIDGIEILNVSIFGSGNKKAADFAKEKNLPFTVGSDAHFPDLIGKVYLEIPGENLSLEEVLDSIKNKKGKIFEEKIKFYQKFLDHFKRNLAKIIRFLSRYTILFGEKC